MRVSGRLVRILACPAIDRHDRQRLHQDPGLAARRAEFCGESSLPLAPTNAAIATVFALNFDTVSDPLLRFALAAGLAVLVLSALMTLQILLLRLQLTLRQRRENRFTARWRPRFLESMQAIPLRLPRIARANWFTFLSLWNQYQESGSATARQRLKTLILQLRMDVAARKLLARGSIRDTPHGGAHARSSGRPRILGQAPRAVAVTSPVAVAGGCPRAVADRRFGSAGLAVAGFHRTRRLVPGATSRRCLQRQARTRSPPSFRPQSISRRPSDCRVWSRCWQWRVPMTPCPGSANFWR